MYQRGKERRWLSSVASKSTNLQLKHRSLYLHCTVHVEDRVDHVEHLEETDHN